MVKINFSNLGWVVALLLLGVMLGSGFQSPTLKIGTADLDKIMQGSNFWKDNQTTFDDYASKRRDLLTYYGQYRMMSPEEVKTLQTLWLKDNATPEDKAALDRIKAQVVGEQKRQQELAVKANTTTEERAEYQAFVNHEQANSTVFGELEQSFSQDVDAMRQKIVAQAMDKARLAVQSVGKAQGYSIVLSSGAAPYSSNDLTEEATKAMNAQK